MARPARVSPADILAAAAAEFAERGYAGARVDRIARRARVNKAMLYYHFRSTERLYRAMLRDTFSRAAARLRAIADAPDLPDVKIERAIEAVAAFIGEHEFFPRIMLREIADGAAHLDRGTVAALAAVPREVGRIIQQGVGAGTFRDVNPLAAYLTMLPPLVVYMAGAPLRRRLTARRLVDPPSPSQDAFIQHMQDTMRRALAPDASR
jgi:TetR/AcrR family transcriptional regulator